jgi:NAD+ kinase
MQPSKSAKHRFERIAFLSSGTPEANAAQASLAARFGTVDPESADVVVALGGDGLMLQTLHRFMGKNKPIPWPRPRTASRPSGSIDRASIADGDN